MTLAEINKKRVLVQWLVIVIMVISLLAYTGGSGLVFGSDSVQDLPQGTVQLTPSIPTMGEHWANPDNYLSDYHCYKVCSLEREPCFLRLANAML